MSGLFIKKMIVTYKYKLRPNRTQSESIDRWIGVCRFIYNLAKETKEAAYQSNARHTYSRFDLGKQITEIRKEYDWIREVNSDVLSDAVRRLDLAFQSFFKGGGFPKWAKKGSYNSMTFRGRDIKFVDGKFKLPTFSKLYGNLKIHKDRYPSGEIKIATLTKEIGGYYLCVSLEQDNCHLPKNDSKVGIDLGIKYFSVNSDGEFIENPSFLKEYSKKLRIEQRSLSRKKKGGQNWIKQKNRLSKLHKKIARKRGDFLHKLSTQIINDNQVIVVEKLKVKNMSKSAKGNTDNPGKNVKAKSGLNKAIIDSGWYLFRQMLEYKANKAGRTFIEVDPKYTSQTCSNCGYKCKENRLSQARFVCQSCGHEENADVNAAKNILERGLSMTETKKTP